MNFMPGFFSVIYIAALFEIQVFLVSCGGNDNPYYGTNDYNYYCPQNVPIQYYGADVNTQLGSQKNGKPTATLTYVNDYTEGVRIRRDGPRITVLSVEPRSKNTIQGGPLGNGKTYYFYSLEIYTDCAENGNGGLTYDKGKITRPIFIVALYYDAAKYKCVNDAIKANATVAVLVTVEVVQPTHVQVIQNTTTSYDTRNKYFQNYLVALNGVSNVFGQYVTTLSVVTDWFIPKNLPNPRNYYGYNAKFLYPNGNYRQNGDTFALVQDYRYDAEINEDQFLGLCDVLDPNQNLDTPRPSLLRQEYPTVYAYYGNVETKLVS